MHIYIYIHISGISICRCVCVYIYMCVYIRMYIYVYIYIFTILCARTETYTPHAEFEISGAFEAEEGFVLDEAAPLLAAAPPTPAISAKAMAQLGTEAGCFRVSSHLGAQKKTDFGMKLWYFAEIENANLLERSVNWWECGRMTPESTTHGHRVK